MRILVPGGAGYIGSHTCIALAEAGHDVVVFDNLSNSSAVAVERVSEIVSKPIRFIRGDIRNGQDLEKAFECGQSGRGARVGARMATEANGTTSV